MGEPWKGLCRILGNISNIIEFAAVVGRLNHLLPLILEGVIK
jgi:hypothetical protein